MNVLELKEKSLELRNKLAELIANGLKKTRRNLRENETLEYAETIETNTEKNLIGYQRIYQKKFREENPYYYAWKQFNRHHPYNKMTEEEYIEYRRQKEAKKQRRRKNNV